MTALNQHIKETRFDYLDYMCGPNDSANEYSDDDMEIDHDDDDEQLNVDGEEKEEEVDDDDDVDEGYQCVRQFHYTLADIPFKTRSSYSSARRQRKPAMPSYESHTVIEHRPLTTISPLKKLRTYKYGDIVTILSCSDCRSESCLLVSL